MLCKYAPNVWGTIEHVDCWYIYVSIQIIFNVRMWPTLWCVCGSIFRHVHIDRVTEIWFCLFFFIAFFSFAFVQIDVFGNVLSVDFVRMLFLHIHLEHEVCNFVHFIPMAINQTVVGIFQLKQKQWQREVKSLCLNRTHETRAQKRWKNLVLNCALEIYPHLNLNAPMQTQMLADRIGVGARAQCKLWKINDRFACQRSWIHFKSTRYGDRTKFDRIFDLKIVNAPCFRSLILSDTSRVKRMETKKKHLHNYSTFTFIDWYRTQRTPRFQIHLEINMLRTLVHLWRTNWILKTSRNE